MACARRLADDARNSATATDSSECLAQVRIALRSKFQASRHPNRSLPRIALLAEAQTSFKGQAGRELLALVLCFGGQGPLFRRFLQGQTGALLFLAGLLRPVALAFFVLTRRLGDTPLPEHARKACQENQGDDPSCRQQDPPPAALLGSPRQGFPCLALRLDPLQSARRARSSAAARRPATAAALRPPHPPADPPARTPGTVCTAPPAPAPRHSHPAGRSSRPACRAALHAHPTRTSRPRKVACRSGSHSRARQAEHVGALVDALDLPGRLLRRNEGRRTDEASGLGMRTGLERGADLRPRLRLVR